MKAIVNANKDWAIGRNNELLVYIPADMKFFRASTAGRTVVMGRKTLESFPGGKPLKGRINIVLTRDSARIPEVSKTAADLVIDGSTGEGMKKAACLIGERNLIKGQKTDEKPRTILVTADSVESLLRILKEAGTASEDVFVIGGHSIYRKLLPYCDTCLVTVNDYVPPADAPADSWFPDLDNDPGWTLADKGELQEYEGTHFCFCTYKRINDAAG